MTFSDWLQLRMVKRKLPHWLRRVIDENIAASDQVLPLVLTADDCVILKRADFADWFGWGENGKDLEGG